MTRRGQSRRRVFPSREEGEDEAEGGEKEEGGEKGEGGDMIGTDEVVEGKDGGA